MRSSHSMWRGIFSVLSWESSAQSMPCPTAVRHSEWVKLAFPTLTPPGLNSYCVSFALTAWQKGRMQLPSLQTQSATQSPIKQGYLSSCSCLPQRWQRLHPLQPRALFLLLHHTPTACSCCHLPWQSKHLHTWAAQRAPACAAVMLLSHLVRMLKLSWCFCQGSAQPQSNESTMDQLLSKPHHCN